MAWTPTFHALRVSAIFIGSTARKHCCHDLSKQLSLPSTTTFDTLRSLQRHGWLVAEEEKINRNLSGPHPRRVLYRITEMGLQAAVDALTSVQIERRTAV